MHMDAPVRYFESAPACATNGLMGESGTRMTREDFLNLVRSKKVLFVTPSDAEYIRNKQEIAILRKAAKCLDVIAPSNGATVKPTGLTRIFLTNWKVIWRNLKKYDVVFVGGIPQLIIPFISFMLGKKVLVIDFFISIYDTIVFDRQIVSAKNPVARLLKILDRSTLSRADCVVVDTHQHAGYFSRTFGVCIDKMVVIYLEADNDIYHPRSVSRPEDLKGKFIAFFFGAMNPLQGVDVILKAARLLEKYRDIVFVIVGPYEKINNLGRYSRLGNIRFAARWLPQNEVAEYIAMSDVCLAGHFNADIPKASRVIPGKAYSYLAMDKPVILGDNPANRELFSEGTKDVHFVKMGNPEALAEAILTIVGVQKG
jgi:glycosyltransferase involved in cell wall biosynthesis